jgi:AraC-like DNA-binding protein
MTLAPGVSTTLADMDEACALGGEIYYPHRLHPVDRGNRFAMRLDVRTFGPLTVGKIGYDSAVRIVTGPLTDGYQFNVPTCGSLRTTAGGAAVIATPTVASVYGPADPSSIEGWADPSQEMLAVKITRSAMEDTLEKLLGRRLAEPLRVGPTLALDVGAGAQAWSLLTVLADQLHDAHAAGRGPTVGGSLFDSSPFADSLAQSVITGLIYAHEHNYAEELRTPVATGGSSAIRQAVEYIETHSAQPISVGDIADHVGLCIRALQQGFAKHVGVTPSVYLRDVRLQRAREALLSSSTEDTTVATVAASWGFFHLGRFAGLYRSAYGETPSATLRKS